MALPSWPSSPESAHATTKKLGYELEGTYMVKPVEPFEYEY